MIERSPQTGETGNRPGKTENERPFWTISSFFLQSWVPCDYNSIYES